MRVYRHYLNEWNKPILKKICERRTMKGTFKIYEGRALFTAQKAIKNELWPNFDNWVTTSYIKTTLHTKLHLYFILTLESYWYESILLKYRYIVTAE